MTINSTLHVGALHSADNVFIIPEFKPVKDLMEHLRSDASVKLVHS
jgi:hypothetical protein